MNAAQSKYTGWLVHLTAWAVVLGMPLFVTSPDRPLMNGPQYARFLLVPLSFMVVFYTNYFVLIRRHLFAPRIGRSGSWHLVQFVAVLVGEHLFFRFVLPPDMARPPIPRPWQDTVRFFAGNALLYMLVVGVSVAIRMTSGWYRAEAARRQLEHSRTQAELQNLKSQLNPHFLFNTLNNIYSLIQLDADRAQQVVHDLSRLLRYVLYDSSQPFVPLGAEIGILRDNLGRLRLRLPRLERLVVAGKSGAAARGAAAVHLARRKRFQARRERRKTLLCNHRPARSRRAVDLQNQEQLFSQIRRIGQERIGDRT